MESKTRATRGKRKCKKEEEDEALSKYFKSPSTNDDSSKSSSSSDNNMHSKNTSMPNPPPARPSTQPLTANIVSMGSRLSKPFFDVPCSQLAKALLGQRLVRMIGSERVSGKIVETEAYLGLEDKAAHSYKGKRTDRNEAMFMQPGTSYVYNIYGMYCCLNISSHGEGCAVLLRALEPVEGIETMRSIRGKNTSKKQKDKEMTNGPSKLCQALQISKADFNRIDLTTSNQLWIEQDDVIPSNKTVSCARINIGYAEDWVDKPLRFYVLGNECVSTRNKQAESEIS